MKTIKNLNDFKTGSRICLYGTGHYGLALFELLRTKRPDICVVRFIDTYKTGELFGIEIIGPDHIKSIESQFDFIVIASDAYRHDIMKILDHKGICNYCDFSFNPIDVPLPVEEEHGVEGGVLYAFYDLGVYPGSFEIVDFMVLADMERQRRDLEHIHLIIVPKPGYLMSTRGNNNAGGFQGDDIELVGWRIRQILQPCAALMPSCSGTTVCHSRSQAAALFPCGASSDISALSDIFPENYTTDNPGTMLTYTPSYFKTLKGASHLPTLRAGSKAVEFVSSWIDLNRLTEKRVITITLRDSPNYTRRNSSIEQWVRFAKSLDPEIYHPLFIKDTFSSFDSAIPGIVHGNIFHEACWNMELRMAVYEQSYVNLFVSNGPAVLCIHNSNCSYIIFKMLVEAYNVTSALSYERTGFPVGSQAAGATPFQRTVWSSDDKFETICQEFELFCRLRQDKDSQGSQEGQGNSKKDGQEESSGMEELESSKIKEPICDG